MREFNLSAWVLEHRAFTGFIMALLLLGGIFAYFRRAPLGRVPGNAWEA